MRLPIDSGECATLEEAIATLGGYGVRVTLADSVTDAPAQQVIALTVINTAARSFQDNGHITAPPNLVLTAPGFEGMALSEFTSWVAVNPLCAPTAAWPEICVGASARVERSFPGRVAGPLASACPRARAGPMRRCSRRRAWQLARWPSARRSRFCVATTPTTAVAR
ncbi:MAG: hypothetical protein ABIR54_00940 [Burkholderiaceae bacterium]